MLVGFSCRQKFAKENVQIWLNAEFVLVCSLYSLVIYTRHLLSTMYNELIYGYIA